MEQICCFLIDDDPDEHLIFALALEETGLDTHCEYFLNCAKATEYISSNTLYRPRFIFVDANVPGLRPEVNLIAMMDLVSRCQARMVIYTGFLSPATSKHLDQWGSWQLLQKNPSISGLASELNTLFAWDCS